MYRFTYEEYWPGSWDMRAMSPAVQYDEERRRHVKVMEILATDNAEASNKARQFIEDSKKTNQNGWPHTAIELVKVIVLEGQRKGIVPSNPCTFIEELPTD